MIVSFAMEHSQSCYMWNKVGAVCVSPLEIMLCFANTIGLCHAYFTLRCGLIVMSATAPPREKIEPATTANSVRPRAVGLIAAWPEGVFRVPCLDCPKIPVERRPLSP